VDTNSLGGVEPPRQRHPVLPLPAARGGPQELVWLSPPQLPHVIVSPRVEPPLPRHTGTARLPQRHHQHPLALVAVRVVWVLERVSVGWPGVRPRQLEPALCLLALLLHQQPPFPRQRLITVATASRGLPTSTATTTIATASRRRHRRRRYVFVGCRCCAKEGRDAGGEQGAGGCVLRRKLPALVVPACLAAEAFQPRESLRPKRRSNHVVRLEVGGQRLLLLSRPP